jgi:hypothetical protein
MAAAAIISDILEDGAIDKWNLVAVYKLHEPAFRTRERREQEIDLVHLDKSLVEDIY